MRSLLILLAVLPLLTGCPNAGGPCSSPETLFPNPVARAAIGDAGVDIDVSWQLSASTPAAFYASPRVVSNASARLLDAGVTGAQLRADMPPAGSLRVELQYFEGPTRTCSHVGMDDTYVLSVVFPETDGGLGTGAITTKTDLGAL